ncbi:hypothetical protein ABT354_20315 [Streptomyces sp. NPDC000594]|uniref:DNA polymerase Y family protein n=1 Tax=Streptomyces sp. NPDC000594 TaxID=3154261 RepID=UPI00332E9838
MHFHGADDAGVERYEELLGVLGGITPRVQALPPTDADCDVTGARQFFGRDAVGLGHLVQMRAAALFGALVTVGSAPNRSLSAMACAAAPPGGIVHLDPVDVQGLLRPRPVAALPGVGPVAVRELSRYGLHTIGALADTPLGTLQRILGRAQGRLVHERSQGLDLRPVTAAAPARSVAEEYSFPRDELDPARHQQAVRTVVEQAAWRLRTEQQVTGRLELTVRYADGSTTTRARTLAEPTAHAPLLARTTYGIYDSLGLQRARVRGVHLRAGQLIPAEQAAAQLSFDRAAEGARVLEEVADRARARWGPGIIRPARLAR